MAMRLGREWHGLQVLVGGIVGFVLRREWRIGLLVGIVLLHLHLEGSLLLIQRCLTEHEGANRLCQAIDGPLQRQELLHRCTITVLGRPKR